MSAKGGYQNKFWLGFVRSILEHEEQYGIAHKVQYSSLPISSCLTLTGDDMLNFFQISQSMTHSSHWRKRWPHAVATRNDGLGGDIDDADASGFVEMG